MQFARQIIGQECSKANILATAVAAYRHDARYFDENCNEPVIIQCFDGEVQTIAKTWHGPKIAVLLGAQSSGPGPGLDPHAGPYVLLPPAGS